MSCFLKIVRAPNITDIGNEVPLKEGENRIGRDASQCSLVLEGTKVSRSHCILVIDNGYMEIVDGQSANGVYVNSKKVSRAKLAAKDRLLIGEYLLELRVGK